MKGEAHAAAEKATDAATTNQREERLAHIPVKHDQIPGGGLRGAVLWFRQLCDKATWETGGESSSYGEWFIRNGNIESAYPTAARPDDAPTILQMEARLRRLCLIAEKELEGTRGKRQAREVVKAAVLDEQHTDPTTVGFLYDTSAGAVEKMRKRAGLDPQTGARLEDTEVSPATS
jgi:hypothetical protein